MNKEPTSLLTDRPTRWEEPKPAAWEQALKWLALAAAVTLIIFTTLGK